MLLHRLIKIFPPAGLIIIVPKKFQGFAYMHLRSDIKVLIAPSLVKLSEIVNMVKGDGEMIYAVYYLKEASDLVNFVKN